MNAASIDLVIQARRRDLGGFEVGRVLPFARRPMVGPFIFLDHIGPLEVPRGFPRSADVRPHPHIGLSTITYLFEGEITHRDSLGNETRIHPVEVNWMTAGRGITHSERFEGLRERGGPLHGLQAWVALPDRDEECEPAFEHYGRDELAPIARPGMHGFVVAGSVYGAQSRVRTHSPLVYAHLVLEPSASIDVPAQHAERALYVVHGRVEIDGAAHGAGELLVLRDGATPQARAVEASTLMLLGGKPVGKRHIWWNFVSSSEARIEQAKRDWRERRFALPVNDRNERIPLPDEPPPPPEPMS